MPAFDFLSPFEELVLTAIFEAGQGSDERQILSKAEELAGGPIPLSRVTAALNVLEAEGCVYSWTDESQDVRDRHRRYGMHFYGHRALEAAAERGSMGSEWHHRGSPAPIEGFIQPVRPSAPTPTLIRWAPTGGCFLAGIALAAGFIYYEWYVVSASDSRGFATVLDGAISGALLCLAATLRFAGFDRCVAGKRD